MSAYYVGFDHINLMLTLAQEYEFNPGYMDERFTEKPDWSRIGAVLLQENVNSLASRYPGNHASMWDCEKPEDFTFRKDSHAYRCNAVTLIKLCDCYEYQSCEHDGWKTSWSKKFITSLCRSVHSRLPGWDNAPWGYQRDPDAPEIISLAELARKGR